MLALSRFFYYKLKIEQAHKCSFRLANKNGLYFKFVEKDLIHCLSNNNPAAKPTIATFKATAMVF
jgi:hypothetical protein